jgi:hypothetical protein
MVAELVLVGSVAFGLAGQIYDMILTERGLKAGVAIEANDWLVGKHPTAKALYLRDVTILTISTLPSVLALVFGSAPLALGFSVVPIVFGVKHILGGLAWARLLKK